MRRTGGVGFGANEAHGGGGGGGGLALTRRGGGGEVGASEARSGGRGGWRCTHKAACSHRKSLVI